MLISRGDFSKGGLYGHVLFYILAKVSQDLITVMVHRPTLVAVMVFLMTGFVTFCCGMVTVYVVGEVSHSGMLGICGPYGPAADWLFLIFFGSVPASCVVGFFCARSAYRQLACRNREHQQHRCNL